MVSALRGEQFNTFSEVIGGIGSGTIGGRQRGEIRTFAQTEKVASRTLSKPPPAQSSLPAKRQNVPRRQVKPLLTLKNPR